MQIEFSFTAYLLLLQVNIEDVQLEIIYIGHVFRQKLGWRIEEFDKLHNNSVDFSGGGAFLYQITPVAL